MPTIRIARVRGGPAAWWVVIDGQKAGKLRHGSTGEYQELPGDHTVQVKINWTGSPEWGVCLADGEIGEFVCGRVPGGRSYVGSTEYLYLRPAEGA